MGGNSVERELSVLVEIRSEEDNRGDLAHKMEERMSKIQSEPAVGTNRCIFKLPHRFKSLSVVNDNYSYEAPQIVSIGPYHRRTLDTSAVTPPQEKRMVRVESLKMMQKFKWECLRYFLKTSSEQHLKHYIDGMRPLEQEAREYYSEENSNLSTDKFVKMMVLDGCFILEWLRFTFSVGRRNEEEVVRGHPLARMEREILLKICSDLLLLENQIPFFVLEKLFESSKMNFKGLDTSLTSIGAKVFSAMLGIRYSNVHFQEPKCLHLLDMVRSIFIPPGPGLDPMGRDRDRLPLAYPPLDSIPRISKLRLAGIRVNPRENDNFLIVKFKNGVIEMPNIILNDLMCSFLVNCVAFEHCHKSHSKYFSMYTFVLDCLVNTAEDIDYLCDNRVIENYIEIKAASFINNLGKALTFDWDYFEFFLLSYDINEYYQNRLHRHWTSFKGEYFNKPWLGISAFVAFVLLVLTFLQTYYTMDRSKR